MSEQFADPLTEVGLVALPDEDPSQITARYAAVDPDEHVGWPSPVEEPAAPVVDAQPWLQDPAFEAAVQERAEEWAAEYEAPLLQQLADLPFDERLRLLEGASEEQLATIQGLLARDQHQRAAEEIRLEFEGREQARAAVSQWAGELGVEIDVDAVLERAGEAYAAAAQRGLQLDGDQAVSLLRFASEEAATLRQPTTFALPGCCS